MLINAGNRTDIPAFYSRWFYNRLAEGSVCVRNPYVPSQVSRYQLKPSLVDALLFGTKNPEPMLSGLDRLKEYNQLWSVSITPYGKDIEPGVPPYTEVIRSAGELASRLGKKSVVWRYDPVFIARGYSLDFHVEAFSHMASLLEGITEVCIISFVDLYNKTLRNFPDVKEVTPEEQHFLAERFVRIAGTHRMRVKSCAESKTLDVYGIDSSGCIMRRDLENLSGQRYSIPRKKSKREGCECLLENEIGAYNSCLHGCLYCYANSSRYGVQKNRRSHDPESPLIIGKLQPYDIIRDIPQISYLDRQLGLF